MMHRILVTSCMAILASLAQLQADEPDARPAEIVAVSEYWIGVVVSPPSAVLQSQLNLPKNQGLVVEVVQPQSPAATAGVQVSDILLSANDKPLADPLALVAAINKAAQKISDQGSVNLDLLRGGKHLSLTVSPVRRPQSESIPLKPGAPLADEMSKVERWLHEVEPNIVDGNRSIVFFHPGQILPKGVTMSSDLAKDAQVTLKTTASLSDGSKIEITRQAGGAQASAPAVIAVTKGKENWTAKEGDLSGLPEKVRGDVEKLLATSTVAGLRLAPISPSTAAPNSLPGSAVVWSAPTDTAVEQRIEAMQKQIDELNTLVRQLKEKSPEKR